MTRKTQKVFCVGFQKTGTTSLAAALKRLGYRVTGPNWVTRTDLEETVRDLARRKAMRVDAVQDNPWPILYRELDEWFPDSKFILSVRASDQWLRSVLGHFGDRKTPMRQWIYGAGSPVGNEAIFIERYERHNRDVQEYFRDRQGQLLVLDLSVGFGWNELCAFLGVPAPSGPFPRVNAVAGTGGGIVGMCKTLAAAPTWTQRRAVVRATVRQRWNQFKGKT